MYERFYGLHDKPFALIPDPKYLYAGSYHREALDFLSHSVQHHARFITMTGEIGSGKTVVLRSFIKSLGPEFHVFQIAYPSGDSLQLFHMLLEEKDCTATVNNFRRLREKLIVRLTQLRSTGKRPLIAIDEAQHLGRDTLMHILDLSEKSEDGPGIVQVVLCGQRILRETICSLETPSSENCRYYHLRRLQEQAVPLYIKYRLSAAGCPDPEIFTQEVISEISRISEGIPRLINTLCDALLVQGYLQNQRKITPSVMKEVPVSLSCGPQADCLTFPERSGVSCMPADSPFSLSDKGPEGNNHDKSARDRNSVEGAQPYEGYRRQSNEEALVLNVLVFERNARMRMHMENQLATLGHSFTVTDDIETVYSVLEGRGKGEFYMLVADAGFFFSAGGEETLPGMSALDKIQTSCADVPIIMTSVLPLTALRRMLFHRGISLLLQKPDMQLLALSTIQVHLSNFFNELLTCLRTTYSQFSAFHARSIKLMYENTDTIQ